MLCCIVDACLRCSPIWRVLSITLLSHHKVFKASEHQLERLCSEVVVSRAAWGKGGAGGRVRAHMHCGASKIKDSSNNYPLLRIG